MQLIQNGTQGPTTPPPKVAPVGTPGYANNTPGVTAPSRWDPDNANTIMAEIVAVIAAAGIALDPANNAQLLAALRAIGFPTGLGVLTTSTTLTAAHAGTFYDLGGSGITITLTTSTFTAGQTIGFLATSAATVTASSGSFYGGALSGSSIAMPAGSLVALQWDGANWRQLAGSFLATPHGEQSFTTSGSFTVPAGVYWISYQGWASGAGGGGSNVGGAGGSGGGAGAYFEGAAMVTPGQVIACTVGTPGTAGNGGGSPTAGGNGSTTSFGAFASATGGTQGLAGVGGLQSVQGMGGTATGGSLNFGGQNGNIPVFIVAPNVIQSAVGGAAYKSPNEAAGITGTAGTGAGSIYPGTGGGGGVNGGGGGGGGIGLIVLKW